VQDASSLRKGEDREVVAQVVVAVGEEVAVASTGVFVVGQERRRQWVAVGRGGGGWSSGGGVVGKVEVASSPRLD
jgi:hypothetical protein